MGAFLKKMDAIVPWKEIGTELEKAIYDGHLGRPGFPVFVLVKAIMLEAWYGLSDPELEDQIRDRVSFQRFLEVQSEEDIPDETTICRFRGKLTDLGAAKELFDVVASLIEESGVTVKKGTLVDATIIEAPRGRKRTDGTSTRDDEAGFTKKNGKTFHGYKVHTATDPEGTFITDLVVTSATVHDKQVFDALTEKEQSSVFADKAYVDQEKKRSFRARGIFWGVLDRASRGNPLSSAQKKHNRQKSSVRAHVEHPFAWMKCRMKYLAVRFRGLEKNTFHAYVTVAAYNLKRLASIPQTA